MRQRSALALPMPAAYFRLLLRRYGGSPTAAAALVADTDVDPEHLAASGEITLGQQLTQFRNLAAREAPGWGLDAGSGFEASTHGPLGFACASAPTLGAALDVLARFAHVRSPFYRVVPAEGSAKSFRLHVEESLPLDEAVRVPLLEMVMLSSQALVELVLGRPAREARFDFAYPAPDHAERYAHHFHAPVRFGRPETSLTIPSAWRTLACPLADPDTYETSVRKLESQLRRLGARDFVVAHVEEVLAAAGDAGLGVEETARRLHLSRRTLARRLAEAGTSFREVLEAHHKERAEVLLRDPSLDVAEVGWRLGYTDAANFGRACRRWFGSSPSRHRQSLLDRS
jgi:AraC-like DNA-binding protein